MYKESGKAGQEMDLLEKARQYEELNRISDKEKPVFHVTPAVGWMNDPNGFSVYQGKIHLFYQYYPYDTQWGPMHWGHQVTEDMVYWQECKAALAPDEEYDKGGCFSGSAIETDEGHVLLYTGVARDKEGQEEQQNQCIAIGDGSDYKKTAERPVITGEMMPEGFSRIDFRDPKVWKDGDSYYLAAGSRDEHGNGQIVLFSSADLYDWTYEGILAHSGGEIGSMWECPDFFALDGADVLICSPQDMKAQGYEFHNGNNALYFLGSYDKEQKIFTKEKPVSLDYGLDFYAPQTTCLPDGRRVLIAWMQSWDNPYIPAGQKWKGMMTLPRELSVKNGRLFQRPVRELECYWKNKICYEKERIEGERQFQGVSGRVIDFTVIILSGSFREFIIDVAGNEEYFTRFTFNKEKSIIEIDRTYSGVTRDIVCIRRAKMISSWESIKLRFIMDKNSVELFVNDGEMVLSTVIYTPLQAQDIRFVCDGSAVVDIEKYDIGQ